MPTFYYSPVSPNARRVWLALLEKNIAFESVILKLDGDQKDPHFLALNPFHQVPVWVDQTVTVLESVAILDYLEARYPDPPLMPTDPAALARVRMVQMVVDNKLFRPATTLLAEGGDSLRRIQAETQMAEVLGFLEGLLGDHPYFGGGCLSNADITLGTALPLLISLQSWLDRYPALGQWWQRLNDRPIWQQTRLTEAELAYFHRRVQLIVKLGQRQMLRP
ncbi:glutathione S-transferase family protein [Prochlorothrix hollandica]|uniref:Glutathione transferase n=1 Tax=Prochlorothrix hollandica PCC 9006 = CALU 1027 TaxID=317619 RepID=A0A0M2PQW0_PROHO|nr:glutathione S-transferase family protein [Prochlorothrix hollandica]KKI98915.1 hypothetical protein PROH_13835 [Prochlorothrix hollandica PCC 9006 = CALU 1027]